MAVVDFNERQLTLKLVYYGPPLSGKTTNLRWIHERVDRLNRGRLVTLDTRDDRTLFFDLLPIFFKTSALSFRVKVYTVPGQPMHETTRRLVLQAADGVVFVADSSRAQLELNRESYGNLARNLGALGLQREKLPIVVQYNKRDLPDRIPDDQLLPFDAVPTPVFPAVACEGAGVLDTFLAALEATWQSVDRDVRLERSFGITTNDFMRTVRAHLAIP